MTQADEKFLQLLQRCDIESLTTQQDVLVGLWPDLRIALVNGAWKKFAEANGGEPDISERFGVGTSILDAIEGPLREYYQRRFTQCLEQMRTWEHLYECSSPEVLRRFQMSVYPLRGGSGLLVVHALVVERPHQFPPESRDKVTNQPVYHSPDGIVVQCSHCRRTQNSAEKNQWHWVREWVAHPPSNTSHGLCPTCLEYYYNEMEGDFPGALSS